MVFIWQIKSANDVGVAILRQVKGGAAFAKQLATAVNSAKPAVVTIDAAKLTTPKPKVATIVEYEVVGAAAGYTPRVTASALRAQGADVSAEPRTSLAARSPPPMKIKAPVGLLFKAAVMVILIGIGVAIGIKCASQKPAMGGGPARPAGQNWAQGAVIQGAIVGNEGVPLVPMLQPMPFVQQVAYAKDPRSEFLK